MNRFSIRGAALALALMTSPAPAANLLANPGFEDPITFEGTQFVGSWEGFSGGAGAFAANNATSPRSGAMHLVLSITNSHNNFAGAFQDVVGLTPGQTAVFSGWHKSIPPLAATPEIRIEWRNSLTNQEVARTNAPTPTLGPDYSEFTLSAPVPAGADTARVVYAVQTFTGPPGDIATIYVDDTSLVVPEPGTMTLFGAGALLLALRRRRSV
jgi:hypothetical protein